MKKYRLLTPGPTEVPEAALLKLAKQVRHHRTPEFRAIFSEVVDGLRYLFDTLNDIVVFASSGTGAMEAAVANVVGQGDRAIVLASGKFSERWGTLCRRFGAEPICLEVPWGECFTPRQLEAAIRKHPDAIAVYATLTETSTGVQHDIEALGKVVKKTSALFVVDGISSVGAVECRTDAWGIDLLAVGSQKALMGPPGLSFLAISAAAWARIEKVDRKTFYFDLAAYRKSAQLQDTPYTPARSLLEALAENLKSMRRIGREAIWSEVEILARATQEGLKALGLRLVAERPAASFTAAYLPEGIGANRILGELEELYGVKLAGGQGPLSGRILRLAHMGTTDRLDVISALAALELVLYKAGWDRPLGTAVSAAMKTFAAASD